MNTKRNFTILLSLTSLLVTPVVVRAQEARPKPAAIQMERKEAAREEMKDVREKAKVIKEDFKEERKKEGAVGSTTKAEFKTRAQEVAKERIVIQVRNAIQKLEEALKRIEENATRVDSRIVKMEEKGAVLTDAKRLALEARNKIALARQEIDSIKSQNIDSFTASTPKQTIAEVKRKLNVGAQKVKEAHKALVDAIAAINANTKATLKDKRGARAGTTTPSTIQ